MATTKVKAFATGGTGPFTYKFELINGCTDGTFDDGAGNSGVNELTVSSANRFKEVNFTWDETECNTAVVGDIRCTVTGINCVDIVEAEKANDCYNLVLRITNKGYNRRTGRYVHYATPINAGTGPFTYKWSAFSISNDVQIAGSDCERIVYVSDPNGAGYTLELTLTDANDCTVTQTQTVPAVTDDAPVLDDLSYQLDGENLDPIIIDVITTSSTPGLDTSLDLSTITITTAPTKGITAIDTTDGTITYTPTAAQTGVDIMKFTVKNNIGKLSNQSTVTITHTPANAIPVIVTETASTDCNVAVTIDVLANDTDADNNIVDATLEIIMQPVNGTAIVTGDYQIKYTPNDNFVGSDIIRYRIYDADGGEGAQSATNFVQVDVGPCCSLHDADISIALTDPVGVDFTATGTGTIPALLVDTMEVDTGGGYGVGAVGTVAVSCAAPVTTPYVNLAYTDGSGNFAPGAGDRVTTLIAADRYTLRFNYGSKQPPGFASEVLDFIIDCREENKVVNFIEDDAGATNYNFWGKHITTVTSTVDYLEIGLNVNAAVTGVCATEIGVLTSVSIETGTTAGVTLSRIECIDYGSIGNTVKFRRTITRSNGCANIVVEKEVTLDAVGDVANNFSVAVLQAGGTDTPGSTFTTYEVFDDTAGIDEATFLTVDAVNILITKPKLPEELTTLQSEIQTWLDANGGGTAYAYWTGKAIIIHVTTESSNTFQTLTTNVSATAFNVVS